MVVEGRQFQMLGHDIQLVLSQIRQQVLRQDQRVDIGGVKGQAHFPAAGADKADIELRVVGGQRAVAHKSQKGRQRLFQRRRAFEHLVGDTGEADDLRRQTAVGVHKGLEAVGDFPVFQHHGADLRNGLLCYLQTRCLDVKAHDLAGEGLLLGAVHRNAVVQIVDEIALHTVKYFYFTLGRMPGVREGLRHAVVGNGNGRMAPADGLLDDAFRVGQRVHIGHTGMEMQFHPLLLRRVLAPLMGHHVDILRVELHIAPVPCQLHVSLHPQPHTGLDGLFDRIRFLALQILADGDRVLIVCHVKGQAPHARTAGLIAFGGKNLSLHHHAAHFGIQTRHGHGIAADLTAHQHRAGFCLAAARRSRRSRGGLDLQIHPVQLIPLCQQLAHSSLGRLWHLLPRFHHKAHGTLLTVQRTGQDLRVMQQQTQLPRGNKGIKKFKKGYLIRHALPLLQLLDLFHQCIHQLLLGHLIQDFPLPENQTFTAAAGHAHVCRRRLPRPVDHAAHHCHRDVL